MRALAVIAVAGLSLSACSGEAESYGDIDALAAAVDGAGVECASLEDEGSSQLVESSGSCADGGTDLFLFASAGDLEDWRRVGGLLDPTVVGPNWAVSGDSDDVEAIADALEAEVLSSD
jgi:hypothetical protein